MKYNKNNETTNRYLAGLVDGDGCITCSLSTDKRFSDTYWKPRLVFILSLHIESYKKAEPTLLFLKDHYGFGSINRDNKGMINWTVYGKQAETLINRIGKHLVIKGTHSQRMISLWKKYQGYGKFIDNETLAQETKDFVVWSRNNTGPIKPKNHISWPWLAGYLDSDGCITRKTGRDSFAIEWNSHERDIAAHSLISKSFGRNIEEIPKKNAIRTRIHFGPNTLATAKNICCPLVKHLRIKRWKMEQALSIVNNPQRLNESSSSE